MNIEDHCFNATPPGHRDAVSCVTLSMALAAIEQARKEEREVWSKWADAVVAELELRAKINNDPYLEISRLRFVELDTLRARKP